MMRANDTVIGANLLAATAASVAEPSPSANPSAKADKSGPDGRSTEFRAVEGGAEARSGEVLLVEAYAALWLILMGWILFLWRRQGSLHSRLDDLEKVIDRAAAAGGSAQARDGGP